jgi:hypothetical protein
MPELRIVGHIENSHKFCEELYEVGNSDVGHLVCRYTGAERRSPFSLYEGILRYCSTPGM